MKRWIVWILVGVLTSFVLLRYFMPGQTPPAPLNSTSLPPMELTPAAPKARPPIALRPHAEPENSAPGLICRASHGPRQTTFVEAAPHFFLQGHESIHPAVDPLFHAVWRGYLSVAESATYRFTCEGSVTLNGEPAQDHEVRLEPGTYALEITFTRKPGPARQLLRWASEHFAEEPVPTNALSHSSQETAAQEALLTERGAKLAWTYNCVGCHTEQADRLPPIRKGPDLSLAGERLKPAWIAAFLKHPRHYRPQAAMPEIPLSDEERQDVTAFLSRLKRAAAPPMPNWKFEYKDEVARTLWNTSGCTACHGKENLSIAGVGSKMSAESLRRFLLEPTTVFAWGCPEMFYLNEAEQKQFEYVQEVDSAGRMHEKVLSNPLKQKHEEAFQLAHLLARSRQAEFEAPIKAGDASRGAEWIVRKGCLACHTLEPLAGAALALSGPPEQGAAIKVSNWEVCGPFLSGGDHRLPFGPEQEAETEQGHDRGDGQVVSWADGTKYEDGKVHDLYGHQANAAVYFRRNVDAKADLLGTAEVGSDDTVSVWVNGELAFESLTPRGMPAFKDQVPIRLRKGSNRLLVKVGNVGGDFQFYFKLGAFLPPLKNGLSVPALVAEARGCLAEAPPREAPRFDFAPEDRTALLAYLKRAEYAPERTAAPVFYLSRRMDALRCGSCHATDHGPAASNGLESPPTLAGAGTKLQSDWIRDVVQGRKRIRPWLKLRMPRFSTEAVLGLPDALHAAGGAEADRLESAAVGSAQELEAGTALLGVGDGRMGCVHCHDFRDREGTGMRGPDLASIHERIRPAWFERWMRAPQRIQPGTGMPTFFKDLPQDDTHRQITLLWKTLAMGKGLPLPPGVEGGTRHVLEVKEQPILVRGYLPDCSSRGIAVGLPGFLSFAFDAESCQVRYAWFGAFLDITRTHTGMGSGPVEVLGRRFFTGPRSQPLRLGRGNQVPQAVFRGYEFQAGIPVFRFSLDGAEASLRVEATGTGQELVLHYEIAAAGKEVRFVSGESAPGVYRSAEGRWEGGELSLPAGPTVRFSLRVSGVGASQP